MKRKFSGFLAGMVLGGAIFGSAGVYAASKGSLIEVFYNVNDIVINRVSKMPKDNKPFIYNGSTYVPLRFIAENLGQSIEWNGSTGTIYIGEKEGTNEVYLGDGLKYLTYQESYSSHYARSVYKNKVDISDSADSINRIKNNVGNEYDNFLYLGLSGSVNNGWNYVEYATNGQYKRFKATISLSDSYKDTQNKAELTIYADDKEIYSKTVAAGFLPEEIDVNISGAVKLKFEMRSVDSSSWDNTTIILGNPRVVK